MKISELFESTKRKSPNEGHTHETFQAWKTDKQANPNGYTSFDRYKEQFGLDEYSVHKMDPKTKYSHRDDSPVLFSHNSTGQAHSFAFDMNKKDEGDYGVYQLRNNSYNGRYNTRPHDRQERDSTGRFGKKKETK